MRYFYVIIGWLLGCISFSAHAQTPASEGLATADSVWYEATEKLRVNSKIDTTGSCTEVLAWGEASGLARVFYPSGHLKEYMPYGDLATGQRHGLATTWFDSGQLQTRQTFWQGQRTDTLYVYYETGALKRKTEYVAGNERLGGCFDPDGQPVAYFPYEQSPLYPGGLAQLTKEITRELRLPMQLPVLAFLDQLQVNVMLQIAEDGRIKEAQVVRSSQLAVFDQAVLVAISKLNRRFSPAHRDGQLVSYAYYLPVQLTLPARPIRRW
jgi:protein TonB